MSYDKSETEYRLTTRGWVHNDALLPDDIVVERWLAKTYQGSGFGKESTHGERCSVNPAFSNEERDALHKQFPAPWSDEVKEQAAREFSRSLERLMKS